MIAVFQNALTHDGWPRFAAHTVFSIIDCLERYRDYRAAKRIHNDDVNELCNKFFKLFNLIQSTMYLRISQNKTMISFIAYITCIK